VFRVFFFYDRVGNGWKHCAIRVYKNFEIFLFFLNEIFFIFLDIFYMLMSKIIFKKIKKIYFNIFLNKINFESLPLLQSQSVL